MPKRYQYQAVKLDLNIDDIREAVASELDKAMYAGAELVLQDAVPRVPVFTGRLRDSGYIASNKRSSYVRRTGYRHEIKPELGESVVAFSAPHAHFVETGTAKLSARPYLRPAYDGNQTAVLEEITGILRQAIEERA